MNFKKTTTALLIAMATVSSALFGADEMVMRFNGCKGPVLCPSFPVAVPEQECCHLWHADIGLLYQQPVFSGMQAAVIYITQFAQDTDGAFVNQTVKELTQCFPYQLGLTVGLGHVSKHDHWEGKVRFDWLSATKAQKSFEKTNEQYKANPRFDVDVLVGSGFNYKTNYWTSLDYKAASDFYSFDVLLSRGSYVSRCSTFEPFMGIKATWFNTSQTMNYYNTTVFTSGNWATYVETQKNWGAGLMFGFNGVYYLTEMIGLFADSDVSVLYGESSYTAISTLNGKVGATGATSSISLATDRVITGKVFDGCHYYVPVRSFLGAQLASYCLNDEHYVAVKIGYDARTMISLTNVDRAYAMSGLTADFVWDF